jgi:hypothetical protein
MCIVNELNSRPSRPSRAYFHRGGKLENPAPVSLLQDNFQHRLKLLEINGERDRGIANSYSSGVQATIAARVLVRERIGKVKTLKARRLARQKTET